jgi:hypothetical protein
LTKITHLPFQVFSKKSKYTEPYTQSQQYNQQYEQRQRQQPNSTDRMGFPQDMRGDEGEVKQYLHDKKQKKELEDLLMKMDDTRNVCELYSLTFNEFG